MFKTLTSGFLENPTLEMSITEQTDDIVLFGKTYRMYKDEWKHHVHLKCTNRCDANCTFCIERPSRHDKEDAKAFLQSAESLLTQLRDQGHLYTVSVTGGEPTLFPYINRTCELCNGFSLKMFSINTNGIGILDMMPFVVHGWFDISKHAIDDRRVFGRKFCVTPEFILKVRHDQPHAKIRFQCVLGAKVGLENLTDVMKFMEAYRTVVDDFSFRSLIVEDAAGSVPALFWDVRKWLFDKGWCVEQTIQDYYVYEVFKPEGYPQITISWSNMAMLQEYNESHRDSNFLEEIIVHPDGLISGSWNWQTLVIN